jgi:hypothetical protein
MWLGLPYHSMVSLPRCVCTHPIDPVGIQILHCAHGNELIGTYDVVHDTFAAIVQNDGLYVGQEKLHVLPSATLNSFSR